MKQHFPRLLVATEFPPNASGGGPAVVRQMLEGWPTERLYWWSCRRDTNVKFGRDVAQHFIAEIPTKLYPHFRLTRVKSWLLAKLWLPYAARHLERTLRETQPEVMWAVPHQWSILPLARSLRRHPSQPYHISLHDSPAAHHPEQRLGRYLAQQFVTATDGLYQKATSRDAISWEMAEDLAKRKGVEADAIIHAGLEPDDFDYLATRSRRESSSIRIAYAGTIVAEAAFVRFVESLQRIQSQLPKPVELHFFGAHAYGARRWFKSSWMFEHGDLPAAELKRAVRSFDWGLAPMELTDLNRSYNRYSLPTKVASYLSAGLAIISLGHSTSTIARLSRRFNFGITIEESSNDEMDALLVQALSTDDSWARYGSELRRCAALEFDATKMRQTLWAKLGVVQE